MKDILSDGQLGKNNVILRDIADYFPVSLDDVSLDRQNCGVHIP
jgi:hypothetical protein